MSPAGKIQNDLRVVSYELGLVPSVRGINEDQPRLLFQRGQNADESTDNLLR